MSNWTRTETRETLYSMQAPSSTKAKEADENLGGCSGLYQDSKGNTGDLHGVSTAGGFAGPRPLTNDNSSESREILIEFHVIELTEFEAQEPPTDLGFLAANSSVVGTKVSRLSSWSTTMQGRRKYRRIKDDAYPPLINEVLTILNPPPL